VNICSIQVWSSKWRRAIASNVHEANKTNNSESQSLVYIWGVSKAVLFFTGILLVNVSVATINMYIMICCVQYKRNTSNIVRESTRCTKSYRRDGRAAIDWNFFNCWHSTFSECHKKHVALKGGHSSFIQISPKDFPSRHWYGEHLL